MDTILSRAEALDGYRAACAANPMNAAARADQRYELFSDSDADILQSLASTIPIASGASIAILHPSADNGYPHTRPPNVICMPAGFLSRNGYHTTKKTLLHEAIHLHQRARPQIWNEAVEGDGWTRVSSAEIPYSYREKCRLNPDTLGPSAGLWAWEGIYIPLPLFTQDHFPRLEDVAVQWLDRRRLTRFVEPPRSFTIRYGPSPPQPEHPFELLAVELSEKGVATHDGIVSFFNS
jgi:hypothetical protein